MQVISHVLKCRSTSIYSRVGTSPFSFRFGCALDFDGSISSGVRRFSGNLSVYENLRSHPVDVGV